MTYTAAEAARIAKGQIGYREPGDNNTKFNHWLGRIPGYGSGGYGYPWCMSFQSWVANMAGGKANTDYPKTAGCEVAVAWFKKHGRWGGETPHVGDLVFYGPGGGTHVELVVAVSKSAITTVGGNTSGSLNGAFHNGDGVYQKSVSRSSTRIYGYGRPVYAAATQEDDMPEPKDLWNWDGIAAPPWIAEDGNKNWSPASYLHWAYRNLANANAKLDALVKASGQKVNVDEGAIVAGVLAGLAPAAVAAAVVDALPPELAKQVVDELNTRLAS